MPATQTFIVSEWGAPRCFGNLARRHYNGLGQLVAEQAVYENWSLGSAPSGWPAYDSAEAQTCSTASNGVNQEIQVNYAYNGLGEVVRTSVPQLRSGSQYLNVAVNWGSVGHTFTQTDALGRPKSVTAPMGR